MGDASRLNDALDDSGSVLNLVLQDLMVLREQLLSKAKCALTPDAAFKALGVLEGVDLAISRPARVVSHWKNRLQEAKEN